MYILLYIINIISAVDAIETIIDWKFDFEFAHWQWLYNFKYYVRVFLFFHYVFCTNPQSEKPLRKKKKQ